jgi:hypothetical protein
MYTVQKWQREHLVPLMQPESILYVTDTIHVTSFMEDFYVLSTSASQEYANSSVTHIPAFSTYSRDAGVDNT